MNYPLYIVSKLIKYSICRQFIRCCIACGLLSLSAITPVFPSIVVIAPHPDDAESSCGGLIYNYVKAGEEVIIITMTGGDLGIWGKPKEEARAIRAVEAQNAANVLGAKLEFFGAVDAALFVDVVTTDRLLEMLIRINPTIVLAPWPLDVHPDHQASGVLAWRAFQDKRLTFDLFFYETSNGPHTKTFQFIPTDYVDISDAMLVKKEATYQHISQSPKEWYGMYEVMASFRGYEADVSFAEGYIRALNSSGLGGRPSTRAKALLGK
jgi:LmbE family N-acetylglucosaminyl deacetylase